MTTTEFKMPKLEASAYLVLQRARYGMDIVEMRKNKPRLRSGQIAVRVNLKLARALFDEFIPTVTAEIEAGDVIEPTIEVEPAPEVTDNE